MGIVGFGGIGRALVHRLNGFDVTVFASDPFLEPEDVAYEPASLLFFETFLAVLDYVSIHSPLTEDTRSKFDAEAFDAVQDDVALINVTWGPIVDETALPTLSSPAHFGPGLDVFDPEPPGEDVPLRGPQTL